MQMYFSHIIYSGCYRAVCRFQELCHDCFTERPAQTGALNSSFQWLVSMGAVYGSLQNHTTAKS